LISRAGADIIFVEAPQGLEEMKRIAEEISAPVLVNADTVIIATGYRPDQRRYNKLLKIHSSLPSKLFSIGDCSKTGKIYDGIHSGFNLGLKI